MYNTILIGTFLNTENISTSIIRNIFETFQTNKVFVFKIKESDNKFLLTFNVKDDNKNERLKEYKSEFKNTVQLHRNKENNTLFTINSLNKIILEQGGDKENRSRVDWNPYKNCCVLLGNDGELKVLQMKLYDIIDIPILGEK